MTTISSQLNPDQIGTLQYEMASDSLLKKFSTSGFTIMNSDLSLKIETFSLPYFIFNSILWYLIVIFSIVLYKYLQHLYLTRKADKQ